MTYSINVQELNAIKDRLKSIQSSVVKLLTLEDIDDVEIEGYKNGVLIVPTLHSYGEPRGLNNTFVQGCEKRFDVIVMSRYFGNKNEDQSLLMLADEVSELLVNWQISDITSRIYIKSFSLLRKSGDFYRGRLSFEYLSNYIYGQNN